MTRLRFIIYFTLTSLFWGGSFLAIHYAIAAFDPNFAALLRISVCFLFIVIYLLWKKEKNLKPKLWMQALVSGVFTMGIPWALLFWGEKYVVPAMAAVLNSTVPIFVVILTPLITPKDKLAWNKWVGVLVGFIGVGLIFAPEIFGGEISLYLKGLMAIIMMAVSYGIGILWTRRLTSHMDITVNLMYQCMGGATLLLILSVIKNRYVLYDIYDLYTGKALLAVLYLGIFSTALAMLMFFRMIKEIGSVQASAVTFCVPLIAVLLDLIFLKKVLTLHQSIGACLIIGGLFVINRFNSKTVKS